MVRLPWLAVVAALALTACSPSDPQPGTPLPTRQTTIDPVKGALEAAAQDAQRRRQAADDATK